MTEFTPCTMSTGRLQLLCRVSTQACAILSPMVLSFYSAITGETAKLKSDASVFTIADGIVQHLLVDHLFVGGKFSAIVGEEDGGSVNISVPPYTVDDLTVPEDFTGIVDSARRGMQELSAQIDGVSYKDLTIFIDPIDGTREFSTELGEQCSICIGFADCAGKPVAGVVYRPITQPPSYAAGAVSEGFVDSKLISVPSEKTKRGFLTSNGKISPFIERLIERLDFERIPSGGAGNKMLMLLEGRGDAYIQDRGVSRWDTCAAQACIEAHGGVLSKLTRMVDCQKIESYTYLKSEANNDFEAGKASLTPYNCRDKSLIKKGDPPRKGELEEFQPYSNLCGLFALAGTSLTMVDGIHAAMCEVKETTPPAYD